MTTAPFLLVVLSAIGLLGGAITTLAVLNKENSGWMSLAAGGLGLIAIALLLLPLVLF
ncbi:hypothetical protein Bra3105_00280 [Brachybacterium halotolerans subsp. kimchii]|uniref:hypothetical protein n=1 Tax=Brachybacterium halotolerans TaxID=2795215 RepID=UPI001E376FA0|nr:hypothetical protein [Brachybacterium halotolerans]UEJ82808.1 hypothetical protein Bra3105_00280 [Brachybacterium halotolerans subsp. kimchii]